MISDLMTDFPHFLGNILFVSGSEFAAQNLKIVFADQEMQKPKHFFLVSYIILLC